jgi:hypothetical protein
MLDQARQQGQELLARGETMVADMLRGYLGQFQEYIGGFAAVAVSACSHAHLDAAAALGLELMC